MSQPRERANMGANIVGIILFQDVPKVKKIHIKIFGHFAMLDKRITRSEGNLYNFSLLAHH